ncbi:Pseudouridine synthase/archaeosine transglycosylase [Prunus yedoensis var. nudiflora]|uniref:Pseudouridine synthase/archaeosine transglycosylase n=1 Tax=Prunus yedoensis var. nudiflora TaxID=2094558 RepID=A0A314Z574_PRUYE|nr:Pseudouridine synthase/archaeosine transglycosylase [Prunus yedoensis var. nudiflora]
MKGALSRNESWDIVILDPPKLAPRKKGAASAAGRKITILREAGAACDHPIDPSYPEGKYLSNILLRVL